MKLGFSISYAGIISALFFAVAHIGFQFFPFAIPAFAAMQIFIALGIFYAVLRKKTGSLLGPILALHILHHHSIDHCDLPYRRKSRIWLTHIKQRGTEIYLALSIHFELAGLTDKAIDYYALAGRRAIEFSSYDDAINHFEKALSLLAEKPRSMDRDKREFDLLLLISTPLMFECGYYRVFAFVDR